MCRAWMFSLYGVEFMSKMKPYLRNGKRIVEDMEDEPPTLKWKSYKKDIFVEGE